MPFERPTGEADTIHGRRFALLLAAACAFVSFLPYLYGVLLEPVGKTYLGYQYNTDDHMVYSAWMHQAREGHFFFDNRFAIDTQPGQTVHLYFFVLGLFAKLFGLALTAALAKAAFSFLFVILLHRLLLKITTNNYFIKLALSVAVVGGGVGFMVWQRFGEAFVSPDAQGLQQFMKGLPTDTWQPEGYVFPSMLTNSLFMVSLCLILGIFVCVLEARESWKPVPWGFLLFGLLMNIHSYDVLLIGLVLVGFLLASLASRTASLMWVARVVAMTLGVVLPALWFWHVLQNDPVFQARAATDTFSPNFRQVFFGLLVMVVLAAIGLVRGLPSFDRRILRYLGAGGVVLGILVLFALAGTDYQRYWMDARGFAAAFLVAAGVVVLLSSENPGWNLAVSWAVVGLVAIYFPALFQRKLAMGLSIPWAVLAAVGLWRMNEGTERGLRNLSSALAILVLGATSMRWFLREGEFIRDDVSRTTVHPVFLNDDATRIIKYLDKQPGRKVVIAMPGIPQPEVVDGVAVLDRYRSPYLPDLNAILSGLSGCYTYAGHWSETPDYLKRRGDATSFFLQGMTFEARLQLIRKIGATHVVAPVPEAFSDFYEMTGRQYQLADVTGLGEVVVDGPAFRLIELNP